MLLLSPSILAADFARLGENMKQADEAGTDYFHVDVMDGMFVPNISLGIPVLQSIRKVTKKALDVHLMIEQPQRYIQKFKDAGADLLTVHYEACEPLHETIAEIHRLGMKAGISIKPHTPVEVLKPFLAEADMLLLMTVEPGFGGQAYMDMCTEKIRELRLLLTENGLNRDVQVDGGITKENIKVVLDAGANVIVMGSSVFQGDIAENVRYFKTYLKNYEEQGNRG